jgi:dTDP-4-amino-4,6-dideoxygalactose transaminase
VAANTLQLPMHPGLSPGQQQRVLAALETVAEESES